MDTTTSKRYDSICEWLKGPLYSEPFVLINGSERLDLLLAVPVIGSSCWMPASLVLAGLL